MHLNGFSEDAYHYFDQVAQMYGPNSPGIMYQYNNEMVIQLGPCRVKCITFDGVWLANEEVLKTCCSCPGIRKCGWLVDVVQHSTQCVACHATMGSSSAQIICGREIGKI